LGPGWEVGHLALYGPEREFSFCFPELQTRLRDFADSDPRWGSCSSPTTSIIRTWHILLFQHNCIWSCFCQRSTREAPILGDHIPESSPAGVPPPRAHSAWGPCLWQGSNSRTQLKRAQCSSKWGLTAQGKLQQWPIRAQKCGCHTHGLETMPPKPLSASRLSVPGLLIKDVFPRFPLPL
jgi:hypothetical protein